jgi:transposase
MRSHSRTTRTNADSFRRLEVITGVGRRRRWSLEEVARRYGLHASQLFVWRQQLQRSPSASEAIGGPAFVPVLAMADDPAPAESVGRMEIAFGPAVVRVGADVDAAALRRVLEVVRSLT